MNGALLEINPVRDTIMPMIFPGLGTNKIVATPKSSHPLGKRAFLTLCACFTLLVPMKIYGQFSSYISQSRVACAQGLGQQAVGRAQAMGMRVGLEDLCVKALRWAANNGRLLDIYNDGTGQADARRLINRLTDMHLSTMPFRPNESPMEMWNRRELTPSLIFDASFARSFLDGAKAPSVPMDSLEMQRRTESCLNMAESLAVCAETGRMQGILAYEEGNAFSDNGVRQAPQSDSQGPDRAQTAAAIDRKFQIWSQNWSMDRYRPGSVQIASTNCDGQCKVSGRFSFIRFGGLHTIDFVAFLKSEAHGKYSVGRLCYKDDTTNMLDCTN